MIIKDFSRRQSLEEMRSVRGQGLLERLHGAMEAGVDVKGRTIYLFGVVTEVSVGRAMAALDVFNHTDGAVRIIVTSCGGEVDAGHALYDAIRIQHNPVLCDVYGQAQSIAALVLQAASYRRLSPETRIMIHPGSATVADVTPSAMRQIATEIEFLHQRYCEILSERSHIPLPAMKKLCKEETYINAAKAVEMGLADEILQVHNPMALKIRKKRRT